MKHLEPSILIVDDMKQNIQIAAAALKKDYKDLSFASSGKEALALTKRKRFDLILLDIMMPDLDGIEVCRRLKENEIYKKVPIIFITARGDIESIGKAFEAGGVDYLLKPFNARELRVRVGTHVKLKLHVDHLDELVIERTRKIEQLNQTLVKALVNANYYNDDETGKHINRVAYYSRFLAEKAGFDKKFCDDIELYAPIHDIGKVAIADSILKKPGKLDSGEIDEMRLHTEMGFKMLDAPEIPQIAKNIVLYHHEKWDGSGYPKKISGKDIPTEARIVAISDVYDALRSKRVYKEAFSREKAEKIIIESSGTHFDPDLIKIFIKYKNEISQIFETYQDL